MIYHTHNRGGHSLEDSGKRVVMDKATGKLKEVDSYDRPEPSKKKVDTDKVRAMLSSNNEQSLIPADKSMLIIT